MLNKDISKMTPYEMFNIECGDGWKELYQPLIDFVENYNKEHINDEPKSCLEITQIKEKFGGLRFYWCGENIPSNIVVQLHEMVQNAEEMSYKTCETCGSKKNVGLTIDGWYTTICEDCLIKAINKGMRERKWKMNDIIYLVNKEGKQKYEQNK